MSDELKRLREYVDEDASEPCAYGDNCADFPKVPSRHGRCRSCKARRVLAGFETRWVVQEYHRPVIGCVGRHWEVVDTKTGQSEPADMYHTPAQAQIQADAYNARGSSEY